MEYQFDGKHFFIELKKRWILIVTCTVLCTALFIAFEHFHNKPSYLVNFSITAIENENAQNSEELWNRSNEIQASMKSLKVYLEGSEIVNDVSKIEGLDFVKEVGGNVITAEVKDDFRLDISVSLENKNQAEILARALEQTILEDRRFSGDSLELIEVSSPSTVFAKKSAKKIVLSGILIGIILSIGCILLLDIFKNTINSERDLRLITKMKIAYSTDRFKSNVSDVSKLEDAIGDKIEHKSVISFFSYAGSKDKSDFVKEFAELLKASNKKIRYLNVNEETVNNIEKSIISLKESFDVIVVDSEPIGESSMTVKLANLSNKNYVIAEKLRTKSIDIIRGEEILLQSKTESEYILL